MTTPPKHSGLRHVALFCGELEASVSFYTEVLSMTVEWNPDPDNYYLTSGNDNLALHRADPTQNEAGLANQQRLDHIGFIVAEPEAVDQWEAHLRDHRVEIVQPAKTHRDGARSVYCKDPSGVVVQIIYHPPLAGTS